MRNIPEEVVEKVNVVSNVFFFPKIVPFVRCGKIL
jgi:hypothetical protein